MVPSVSGERERERGERERECYKQGVDKRGSRERERERARDIDDSAGASEVYNQLECAHAGQPWTKNFPYFVVNSLRSAGQAALNECIGFTLGFKG